ncbi:phosphatase PAP2 family protein [Comamonas sp. MYb69]|uniref:phosphatase PAP2 family protein n=1 Tax=Comamonas sp. MYb69 TaxID=1848650 RepID=UPI0030A85649
MVEMYMKEVRAWATLFVVMALLAESVHLMLYGHSYISTIMGVDRTLIGHFIQWSFPLAGGAIFFAIAGWLPWGVKGRNIFAVIGLVFVFFYIFATDEAYQFYSLFYIFAIPLGWGLFIKAIYYIVAHIISRKNLPEWVSTYILLTIATISLGVATNAALRNGVLLYPLTYDYHLIKIDAAFGGFSQFIAKVANEGPNWIRSLTVVIYSLLALLFFPLVAMLIREKKIRSLHGWRMLVLPFGIAWICYLWLPATGPIAVYGLTNYPSNIPGITDIPSVMATVQGSARNAVPSMHLSGAIWVLMICASFRRKFLFALSIFFLLGTAWATLALGEHYLIDLVIAVPFATAVGVSLMNPPRWQQAPSWAKKIQLSAIFAFFIWMILLRFWPIFLEENIRLVQIMSIFSVGFGILLLFVFIRCVWDECDANEDLLLKNKHSHLNKAWRAPVFLPKELKGNHWLVGIFFFSGLAGLVYEVVYAKALGVTFGGTSLAAKTVLMTYMGGMALGAWLGGLLAERTKRPLLWYAYFEAAIGLYAAITPLLFSAIQLIYVMIAEDRAPDAGWLTILRMSLGAAVLGVPTILMGATLPLVFQCLRSMGIPTGRAIAPLYGANVLGAAVGALIAGYLLLPAVGRNGGTFLAAAISLLVSLYVIEKLKKGSVSYIERTTNRTVARTSIIEASTLLAVDSLKGHGALCVLLIGGIVTLALEVVFMHLLAVVAGNSVYAFGLMLATFLLGLGLGSTIGEWLMRHVSKAILVGWAQAGIALSILLTSFVWDGLANYMGSFQYAMQRGLFLDFAGREFVRASVCALAMMPPAIFIGVSYPAAMGLAADWLGRTGNVARGVGIASGINTLGNIAGVLFAGFWWLPIYGSRNVLLGLAIVALILSVMMLISCDNSIRSVFRSKLLLRSWIAVGFLSLTLINFPSKWDLNSLSQGSNVYFYPQPWGKVIDHAESVEGGLTTVAQSSDGMLTLLTNGKFQGNNAEEGEMVAQESFALIPLLHTTKRDNALVIGYGTGMTARVLQDQGFVEQDVVELSRDIVLMADKHFKNINANISMHPSVHMHYTDGRNYLLTQTKKFDLISLEITSIWFAGAANLYNREFYEIANKRLLPGGVLQQWVQMHHMRPVDFLYIIGSVRSVFKNVWVYVSGGQGIIVASNDDVAIDNELAVQRLLTGHTISSIDVRQLPGKVVAGPAQVNALLSSFDPSMSFFVSTDRNLYLEYATPKGNAITYDSVTQIVNMLKGAK